MGNRLIPRLRDFVFSCGSPASQILCVSRQSFRISRIIEAFNKTNLLGPQCRVRNLFLAFITVSCMFVIVEFYLLTVPLVGLSSWRNVIGESLLKYSPCAMSLEHIVLLICAFIGTRNL